TIAKKDLDLIQVLDTPEEVVNAIFDFYESRGFEPTSQEHEKLLEL
ncbi:MAG TPA: TIGR00730 family Rossman fold protein, partial [Gammaproteobacteria bacterium]|nr:TIGR00730 family Rossman fold protein [Gammaproteobacteria bacterium]